MVLINRFQLHWFDFTPEKDGIIILTEKRNKPLGTCQNSTPCTERTNLLVPEKLKGLEIEVARSPEGTWY